MTGSLYFTKEFAGHQRRLLIRVLSDAGISCFIGNLSIVVGYGLWIMGLLSLLTICLLILLKFAIDAVLIHKSHSFLTTAKMQYLILSSLFYPFFSVVLLCIL
jgi:hypothetical protein